MFSIKKSYRYLFIPKYFIPLHPITEFNKIMDTTKKAFASKLLKIKAIKLQPANPFTWASGWKSPFYCDNRKTLSYPELRNYVLLRQPQDTLLPRTSQLRETGDCACHPG